MSVVKNGERDWPGALVSGHWRGGAPALVERAQGAARLGPGPGLGFVIGTTALMGEEGVLGAHPLTLPEGAWVFRIDEVAFPVGAVAHRHTHSGSGWRHLVSGALRIEAEDHVAKMAEGDSWFEPAGTPVRAVALQTAGVTRFVRCMAVPAAFLGRSTFQLCDPEDAALPRLQQTHRLLDHPVQVDAG